MKHDQLQEDLAAHLRAGTDRMVWTNTQLGPSGSPRPDVFTVNKSFSRFRTDCYEIKVSVSDLRSDVTSGKWQSYRKYGHAVWFAFPRGMAPLELIPRECGVILRSDSCWRAARKPVAQVFDTLPRDTWLKLLMELHPDALQRGNPAPRSADEYRAAEIVRKRFGDKLADLFGDTESMERRLRYRQESLKDDIARLDKEIADRRAMADESTKRAQIRLDGSMRELGELLGLPAGEVTAETLAAAVSQFRRRLDENSIAGAIKQLQVLQGVLPASANQRWVA